MRRGGQHGQLTRLRIRMAAATSRVAREERAAMCGAPKAASRLLEYTDVLILGLQLCVSASGGAAANNGDRPTCVGHVH